MKRYQKANEGIHAPDGLKQDAARPTGKARYARWTGAVAAVLAVALLGGTMMWPGAANGPTLLSNENGPVVRTAVQPVASQALALAEYPETAPYPKDEDFISPITGELQHQKMNDAWDAWRESMDALSSGIDYTGVLDGFLTASTTQFLSGAGEENRVYSPLNVYMALSMLAETTGENTRQQILDLLQVSSVGDLRERASVLWRDNYRDDGVVTSILANSLWLSDSMTYSKDVLARLAKDYYASSFSGAMGSSEYDQALRDWLNEQTRGLLSQQVEGLSMDPQTVLALASTIYFKATWDDEFQTELTETDTFHAPTGDVDTDFMHRTMATNYYWGDRFAAVELNFRQGGSMWLVLPDEGHTVDELLECGEAMDFLLAEKTGSYDENGASKGGWPGKKHLNVNLSMPKFDVSSDLDLIEGLKALGVTDVFDYTAANFDPLEASTNDPLYVSQAQHAARVKVDEEGCEAAAYTIFMVECGAAMPPADEVDFTLDRPFLFAITGDSGLPLFTGVVNQPNG